MELLKKKHVWQERQRARKRASEHDSYKSILKIEGQDLMINLG